MSRKKVDIKDIIKKAKEKHGDRYDYSQTFYVDNKKINIICPIHGYFEQRYHDHLNGHGCPECANNETSKKLRFNKYKVIENFKKIHGDKYDYSKVEYINDNTKVEIICSIHGSFWKKPSNHLRNNQGCPYCIGKSKGETKIKEILDTCKINYIQEAYIRCFNPHTKRKLHFDFYLPDFNTCIEYDGRQHFFPIEYFGGEDAFKKNNIQDTIKTYFCNREKINLIRIPYWEFDTIENILKKELYNE